MSADEFMDSWAFPASARLPAAVAETRRRPTLETVRATIILIAVLFGLSKVALAEDDTEDPLAALPMSDVSTNKVRNSVTAPESVPTIRILPNDVVQDSIQQIQFATSKFAVRWTYTEAGAKKLLAFREAHEGEKMRTVVGNFETPATEIAFRLVPPASTNYTQWKEGWLKRRTDKAYGVGEEEAKAIAAGLKSR
jgi:hypothetical protein